MADRIVITDEFFGGEEGFKSILNDYYENTIEELPEEDRTRAREFIEEGLILNGRRIGMTKGVEKDRYSVDQELLDRLLASRLIRVEVTHLGPSFEVSHDTLVEPITKSYEERDRREKEEQRRAAEERRVAEVRKIRRRNAVYAFLAILGFALATVAIVFYFEAETAKEEAQLREEEANQARRDTEQALQDLRNSTINGARSQYQALVAEGTAAANARNYVQAVEKYQMAIKFVIDLAADAKDSSLADSIDNNAEDARRLRSETDSIRGSQVQYDGLIAEAERFEASGNQYLREAERAYEAALKTRYNPEFAQQRLDLVRRKIPPAFAEFKRKGSTFFDARGYHRALRNYQNALKLYPNDQEVKARIEECQEKLK